MIDKKVLSPRQAIRAKCKECIYDPFGGGGTWIEQVEGCTSYSCPLFELRPLSRQTRLKNDEKFLASLSEGERIIIENSRRKRLERLAGSTKQKEIVG